EAIAAGPSTRQAKALAGDLIYGDFRLSPGRPIERSKSLRLGRGAANVGGDSTVKLRHAVEDFGFGSGSGKSRDCLKLRDPSVGLGEHPGHSAAQLGENVGLALRKLGVEGVANPGPVGRQRHG